MRALVAFLLLIGSGSQALAGVQFCNKFDHPIRFAVAFQTPNGWVAEGWLRRRTEGLHDRYQTRGPHRVLLGRRDRLV